MNRYKVLFFAMFSVTQAFAGDSAAEKEISSVESALYNLLSTNAYFAKQKGLSCAAGHVDASSIAGGLRGREKKRITELDTSIRNLLQMQSEGVELEFKSPCKEGSSTYLYSVRPENDVVETKFHLPIWLNNGCNSALTKIKCPQQVLKVSNCTVCSLESGDLICRTAKE